MEVNLPIITTMALELHHEEIKLPMLKMDIERIPPIVDKEAEKIIEGGDILDLTTDLIITNRGNGGVGKSPIAHLKSYIVHHNTTTILKKKGKKERM